MIIVGFVGSILSVSLRSLYLPTAAEGITNKQKRNLIRSHSSFGDFCARKL